MQAEPNHNYFSLLWAMPKYLIVIRGVHRSVFGQFSDRTEITKFEKIRTEPNRNFWVKTEPAEPKILKY